MQDKFDILIGGCLGFKLIGSHKLLDAIAVRKLDAN